MALTKPECSDAISLDVEALRSRIQTLDFAMLVTELAEEAAMREIEATGRVVLRRPDARLAVVLAPDAALRCGVAA
jgi:hypothetical protein